MLVKEVGRGRLVIGQQREKLKKLHKTFRESKATIPTSDTSKGVLGLLPKTEDNATTARVTADGPLTGTALSLLPDALPMTAANPPPAHPDGNDNGPDGDIEEAATEEGNVRWVVKKANIALTAKYMERRRRRQQAGQARPLDTPPMTVATPLAHPDEELNLEEELDNHDLGNFDIKPGGAGGQQEQVMEDQGTVETLPQKDLIELGAEDNATTVEIHTSYRRARSGATTAPTTSVNIPGAMPKVDNRFRYSLDGSQLKAKMPARGLPLPSRYPGHCPDW